MRGVFAILTVLAVSAAAQCPLGYGPDEACPVDNPSCALFVDEDGDGFCDNPIDPQAGQDTTTDVPQVSPDTTSAPESGVPEDTTAQADTSLVEQQTYPHPVEPDEPLPDEPTPEITVEDPVEPDTIEELPVASDSLSVDEPEAEPSNGRAGAASEDTITVCCPLGYSPEEACFTESPDCTLFRDSDGNDRCDNPGPQPDSTGEEVAPDTVLVVTVCDLVGSSRSTCPLDLPPEAACPDSQALCPHWYGSGPGVRCAGPSGGLRRNYIVLISLGLLLIISTVLSRKLHGKTPSDRRKRKNARCAIHAVSLMLLGFVVQGCFCPLGTFQYLFVSGGIAFMGIVGLAILLLPVLFSLFVGRVFCGWICPMGGFQDMCFRIPLPGRPRIPKQVSKALGYLKYLVLAGLVAIPLISPGSPLVGDWSALFCRYDPFRTVFTFFLVGSLLLAGILILLSLYFNRFFCRYFCFYGALLSITSRARFMRIFAGRRISRELEKEVEREELEAEGEEEELQ